jgi:hypothetical protein
MNKETRRNFQREISKHGIFQTASPSKSAHLCDHCHQFVYAGNCSCVVRLFLATEIENDAALLDAKNMIYLRVGGGVMG